jgi:hypothetical protein
MKIIFGLIVAVASMLWGMYLLGDSIFPKAEFFWKMAVGGFWVLVVLGLIYSIRALFSSIKSR